MSTFDYINKMRRKPGTMPKIKEALRAPSVKTDAVQTISYGPATTVDEEVARRFKTVFLPQVANLCTETESFYNMYSRTHETPGEVKKQEKELKPVKDLYSSLMKAQDVILGFIATRKKSKSLKETIEATPDMDQMASGEHNAPHIEDEGDDGEDTSDVERLLTIIQELGSRNDLVQILSKVENADELADQLEEALNAHESELSRQSDQKEY